MLLVGEGQLAGGLGVQKLDLAHHQLAHDPDVQEDTRYAYWHFRYSAEEPMSAYLADSQRRQLVDESKVDLVELPCYGRDAGS